MPRRTSLIGVLGLALSIGCDRGGAGSVRPQAGQNVLIITIDTLRADHLGAYGDSGARTPHIDRLAREGVLFEQAIAQVPVTLPSHASLFTGLLPPTHGVRDNTYFRLDSRARTLAETLKEAGYETAAFVAAFVLDGTFGLDQGFDRYDDEVAGAATSAGTIAERRGELVSRSFVSWLEKRSSDQPFFAWLHFFDPHLPHAPPPPYEASYEGEIAYVDEQVGRVLEALAAKGAEDETLVVLTSDHGESLGEHGEKSHGFFVYEATLRVPLILWSASSLPRGVRIAPPVRSVDVLPTVLETLEIPVPEETQGRSLLPFVRGEAEGPRPVYAECYVSELNFGWAPLVALREDGYKYIDAPRPELYRLDTDPNETRNLFDEEPDRAARMRSSLAGLVEELPGSLSSRDQPDPETVSRLRSLGYAAAGAEPAPSRAGLADPKDRLHLWTKLEEVILQQGSGDSAGVIAGALEVLEEDPTNLLALELLAGARADSGELDEAIAVYRRILSIDSSRPLSHVLFGNLLWQAGDLKAAEGSFGTALELDPDYARAHRRLAELYFTRGETEKALASFRRADELEGDDVETSLGIARSLKASGDVASAMKELEGLHARNPQDPEVLAEYAGTVAQQGDAERALTLLAAGPDHHDVHYTRSVILRAQDRMPEALQELEKALALEPRSAVALHDQGVILSRMGKLPEAVASLTKALAVLDSPSTRNALGTALCRMDRCGEAIPHFERAIAAAPDFVEALENLSQAYAIVGRSSDSEKMRRRADALKANAGARRTP
jgi:arylsulfatase A-like enzyme/Flp pilus assembly protein TadD